MDGRGILEQMRDVDARSWSCDLIYGRGNRSAEEGEGVENACWERDMGQMESQRMSQSQGKRQQPLNQKKIPVLRLLGRRGNPGEIC